jgi:hypothetical protein
VYPGARAISSVGRADLRLCPFSIRSNLGFTWNVLPPPVPNNPPVVQAVIQAQPPEAFEFGDAQWMKVFVREGLDQTHRSGHGC